jgi:hypothetical protein
MMLLILPHPSRNPPSNRRWYGTTIEFVRELKRPVTLTELKTHKEGALKDMQLLRMPRLSVQVTCPREEYNPGMLQPGLGFRVQGLGVKDEGFGCRV